MKTYLSAVIQKIMAMEKSPYKLARSLVLGIWIAWSPFLGIQTWLVFLLGWPLHLNVAVVFATLYLVNNPWTMIPLAVVDYTVGRWLMQKLFGISLIRYNPGWMSWVNTKLQKYLSAYVYVQEISLWEFIIGGLIVSSLVSLIAYPLILSLCKRLPSQECS
jgi:uncharacterized protein (DUF2062 family)